MPTILCLTKTKDQWSIYSQITTDSEPKAMRWLKNVLKQLRPTNPPTHLLMFNDNQTIDFQGKAIKELPLQAARIQF